MRLIAASFFISCLLSSCILRGPNPQDPFEMVNRKTHQFNTAFDATFLKPPARLYKAVIPAAVRSSVNNFYNNLNMLPSIANDILQNNWAYVSNDAGRFVINSTIGLGGLFDVASQYHLPFRRNDLGITFAKWGDTKSPYIVIPFLGPSTIRDGMGMLFEYTLFTPYPYLGSDPLIYSLIGLRYIDLRSQFLETDHFIAEALDPYTFIRDAYLQHRHYVISGEEETAAQEESGALYVDEENAEDSNGYVDE